MLDSLLNTIAEKLVSSSNVIILLGAGISTACGIHVILKMFCTFLFTLKDFRGENGIYKTALKHVFEPNWINSSEENSDVYINYINQLRRQALSVFPSNAHYLISFLSKFESVNVVTQNIDNLEKKAGAEKVIYLHGNVLQAACNVCGYVVDFAEDFERTKRHTCSRCALSVNNRTRKSVKGTLVPNLILENDGAFHIIERF